MSKSKFGKPKSTHDVFFGIADPIRRSILALLVETNLSIATITRHFKLSRTAINKHLRILTYAKLVTKKEIGRETIYDLNATSLLVLEDWLEFFDEYWDERLGKLKRITELNLLKVLNGRVAT